ncbi:MAG TPA: protein kinase [Thermoanaerobaculia bacterium]|nr:protein kinase [Thermoanaerobaculia bacterium]
MTGPTAMVSDILIVDDTPANLDLLCGMLRDRGYRVRVATSGPRALAAVRAERPDLLLLDVTMPGMSGYDVCRQLKSDNDLRGIPVIFISALDEVVDKVRAFESGGADYVTKPFQFGEVLARIDNQLRIQRLQRDLEQRNAELLRLNQELSASQQRQERILTTLSDVLPGTVLDGKFRLENKLGSGGFGTVYRATQLNLARPVAVKVFHSLAGRAERADLERFRREGISACRINHPNAVAIIDSGVSTAGIAYLVTELLDGRTVSGELEARGGKMSPLRMLEIAQPVCQVLSMAHAAGIVHRDVKPENVFLHNGPTGEMVKVLDFGIAKLLDEQAVSESLITSRHVAVGTPLYMAPEQMCNELQDGRADVYSLAVMVYQMLTGTLPFEDGYNFMSIAMLKLRDEPAPMRTYDPTIPRHLDEIVLSALSRDPKARPTAARFEEMLVRAVERTAAV